MASHLGPFSVPCLGTPVLQFQQLVPSHGLCDGNRIISKTCKATSHAVGHLRPTRKVYVIPLAILQRR